MTLETAGEASKNLATAMAFSSWRFIPIFGLETSFTLAFCSILLQRCLSKRFQNTH
jgi:hypothetical protein